MRSATSIIDFDMPSRPDQPSINSIIESCSIMNALTVDERAWLAERSFIAYAERSEVIWLAGAESSFFAIGGVGFVKMTRTTPQGGEVAVELLGPGQCFGVLAALEGRAFPLAAIAVTNTWYLKVPTAALNELYGKNELLRDQMLRHIAPRLRKAHDMMSRMSANKVEQRIAAILFILMESYGRSNSKGAMRLSVPLTRQDISEMAGTTVETCIRVMSKWQKSGLVTTDKQVITIRDVEGLQAVLVE